MSFNIVLILKFYKLQHMQEGNNCDHANFVAVLM